MDLRGTQLGNRATSSRIERPRQLDLRRAAARPLRSSGGPGLSCFRRSVEMEDAGLEPFADTAKIRTGVTAQ